MSESFKKVAVCLVLALTVVWVGCAPAEEAAEETTAEMAHDDTMEAEVDGEPRVFFVSPEDGATVTSPVLLQFGPVPITKTMAKEIASVLLIKR